jgi:hypothetical protein
MQRMLDKMETYVKGISDDFVANRKQGGYAALTYTGYGNWQRSRSTWHGFVKVSQASSKDYNCPT